MKLLTVNDINQSIPYLLFYTNQIKRDDWDCDSWVFKINQQSFEFFTGLGLRLKGKPKKPLLSDLLHSVISDSYATQIDFEEWASTFGYDSDSTKALNLYLDCQKNYSKLRKAIPPNELSQIKELLTDY